MNDHLLQRYNSELRHVRGMAAEFARQYPKVAGRLGMDPDGREACQDPFVERLIESFAFLTARIQVKLDAEFPRFTQALLETIYPDFVAPIPSMTMVQFEVDEEEPSLAAGKRIPRGARLRSGLGKGERTACTFTTSQEVTLFPFRIAEARYFTRDLGELKLPCGIRAKAALRLRLAAFQNIPFAEMALENLPVYLRGADELPGVLLEQILAHRTALVLQQPGARDRTACILPATSIRRHGFSDEQALLPILTRTFQGSRLLREYFSFPHKFQFFQFSGIRQAIAGFHGTVLDLIIPLKQGDARLEGKVNAGLFGLYCTPAINLFPREADHVAVTTQSSEFQVIVDRSRPVDFEIHSLLGVTGHGATEQPFAPFYRPRDGDVAAGGYFSMHRRPRVVPTDSWRQPETQGYPGTEVFLSLVDPSAGPFQPALHHLAVRALVTNRHLPLQMALGSEKGDFFLENHAPLRKITCIVPPTRPHPPGEEGEMAWRFIGQLSLNYETILDGDGPPGAALRAMLQLHARTEDRDAARQVASVRMVRSKPILRRLPGELSADYARGLEVAVLFDEAAFAGSGPFLLGAVLEQVFGRYASLNSFTEMVVETLQRGEVMRWPAQMGQRRIL